MTQPNPLVEALERIMANSPLAELDKFGEYNSACDIARKALSSHRAASTVTPQGVGENHIGAAELAVGQFVYRRIDKLMNAKANTPAGHELAYLAEMVAAVEEYGALGDEDGAMWRAEHFTSAQPAPPAEGWRPIETAPKDGTVFLGCDLDHPSFGTWPMYRRVRHSVASDGEMQTIDLGGWMILHDVEPDYHEGHNVGPDPEVAVAPDDLNTSVRYGWLPLLHPNRSSERS